MSHLQSCPGPAAGRPGCSRPLRRRGQSEWPAHTGRWPWTPGPSPRRPPPGCTTPWRAWRCRSRPAHTAPLPPPYRLHGCFSISCLHNHPMRHKILKLAAIRACLRSKVIRRLDPESWSKCGCKSCCKSRCMTFQHALLVLLLHTVKFTGCACKCMLEPRVTRRTTSCRRHLPDASTAWQAAAQWTEESVSAHTRELHAGSQLCQRHRQVVPDDGEVWRGNQGMLVGSYGLLQAALLLVNHPQIAVRLRIARVRLDANVSTSAAFIGSKIFICLPHKYAELQGLPVFPGHTFQPLQGFSTPTVYGSVLQT